MAELKHVVMGNHEFQFWDETLLPRFRDNRTPRKIRPGVIFENDFNVSPAFKKKP